MKDISLYAMALLILLCACGDDSSLMTETGYRYEVIEDVAGETAKPGDNVLIHAVLFAEDSTVFDSRTATGEPSPVKVPDEEVPRGNLAPIQDLLVSMSKGDKFRLYYPLDSFKTPPPSFASFEEIIYELEVVEVMEQQEFEEWVNAKRIKQQEATAAVQAREAEVAVLIQKIYSDYKQGKLDNQISRTASGLGYIIHDDGNDNSRAQEGQLINAHYYGVLEESGEQFDNSFKRGQPYPFRLGRREVIPGWDEGFALLNNKAKATLFIPPSLAYGERGYGNAISPNASLIFYVEVDDIQ